MTKVDRDILWVNRFAPKTVKDCILPAGLKSLFQGYVDNKQIPNMILAGTQGLGKTTVAFALCNELKADHIKINGSDQRGVDMIRTTIREFGSSVSMRGGRKVIIIDEADNLTPDCMLALRGVIEELGHNVSFILTCNYKNRLLPAIQSRLPVIDFTIPKEEKPKLAQEVFTRMLHILGEQSVKHDKDAVIALIKKHFPDIRRVIGELQKYSMTGAIDLGILTAENDTSVDILYGFMKNKDFKSLRKAVTEIDNHDLVFTQLYDKVVQYVVPKHVPLAIVLIGKYVYQNAFVASREINLAACLSEIFLEVQFND